MQLEPLPSLDASLGLSELQDESGDGGFAANKGVLKSARKKSGRKEGPGFIKIHDQKYSAAPKTRQKAHFAEK